MLRKGLGIYSTSRWVHPGYVFVELNCDSEGQCLPKKGFVELQTSILNINPQTMMHPLAIGVHFIHS